MAVVGFLSEKGSLSGTKAKNGERVAMERRLDEAVEVVFDMLANSLSPDMIGGSLCSLFGGNSGPVPFPASMRRFNYGNSLHVLRIIVKLVLVLNFVEL
ncbi:hypothetical protein DY000_02015492 [Brassica cretica]|uniref:Uncharacterized protein n=1 Tax=Brassica cretica TaxID=69181 RepID=A0ABQ7CMI4_BRACR|nr:hypothetical protein DY000_02015492 [Brassica cretica]